MIFVGRVLLLVEWVLWMCSLEDLNRGPPRIGAGESLPTPTVRAAGFKSWCGVS